jgi:hypothetical protein
MSDHPDAEISLPDNTQHSQQTNIHALGGIRTRNPSNERPQTHALDRAAIGIEESSIIMVPFSPRLSSVTRKRKSRNATYLP